MNPDKIGRAYLAYSAFNHSAKKERIKEFNLDRWAKVIDALDGTPMKRGPKPGGTKWSAARRAKFEATVAKRKTKQPNSRTKLNGKLDVSST